MKAAAARLIDRAAGKVAVLGADPREAWTGIADDILAARKIDPEATQAEIGKRMGQSGKWVSRVLEWRTKSFSARRTPFAHDDWEHRKQQIATKTPVKQADRVKMAEELLEDRKVVEAVLAKPTVASRRVANAVHEKETAAKQKKAEQDAEYQQRRKESLPGINGVASRIVTKVDQWAVEIDSIRDDLAGLEGRNAELVDMALGNLARAAEAGRDALGRPAMLHVIDGKAKPQTRQLVS